MSKTINIELTEESIQSAIRQIQEYKKEIVDKTYILAERLAGLGLSIAQVNISQAPYGIGSTIHVSTETSFGDGSITAIVIAVGTKGVSTWENKYGTQQREYDTLLFVEFGAGIHFNAGNTNPLSGEFGMGVGTFPDQTHAFDVKGWYWKGKDDEWHHSYGIKAQMPMYKASVEIAGKVNQIAREVFS